MKVRFRVEVTVSPSDKKVEQLIASHFKNQVIPVMFMGPQMPMFDEVMINDTKVT